MTTPNKEKRMAAALKEPKEKPAQQLVVPETSYSKRDAPVVQHPQAATSLVQALAAAAQDPAPTWTRWSGSGPCTSRW
jgi:hypothetical protein